MTKNNVESRLPFIMPALIKSEILGLSPPPRRQTSGIYLFINGKYAYVIATIDRKKPPKKNDVLNESSPRRRRCYTVFPRPHCTQTVEWGDGGGGGGGGNYRASAKS